MNIYIKNDTNVFEYRYLSHSRVDILRMHMSMQLL